MSTPVDPVEAQHCNTLGSALSDGSIATCVKDASHRVTMQNPACLTICGERIGEQCDMGCMELLAADRNGQWPEWGSRVYKNSLVHGDFYDVTLLCSDEHIISFLQPLKDKQEAAMAFYHEKGLTERESEIITLTIQGVSNSGICERLSISRATLKTHLNKVYGKLRGQGEAPRFLPGHRSGN